MLLPYQLSANYQPITSIPRRFASSTAPTTLQSLLRAGITGPILA